MFINYEKLADKLISKDFKEELTKRVADIIANKIVKDSDIMQSIKDNLYVREISFDNTFGRGVNENIPLELYVGKKVAGKLIPDVYDLRKAEVLQNVHTEGILNILHKKLEEQAKQHVLDFITNDPNNRRR